MDSLELDLITKLNNFFMFNLKVKCFKELSNKEILDVYQFLLRVYDQSWIVKLDKSTATSLKQIQNFFHRMELGHLAPKSEDLLDNRKLCRLFGACISKLESRHNGGKNLLAAVRKIRKQKSKVVAEREIVHKPSSGSSNSEEPFVDETIPYKGREIPRTPCGKESVANQTAVLFKSPPNIPENLQKPLLFSESSKGFRPILPTKEIPRTPIKGLSDLPIDSSFLSHQKNPNFTYDFTNLKLTDSNNTSTPYDSRTSTLNATYVVPILGKMEEAEDEVFLPVTGNETIQVAKKEENEEDNLKATRPTRTGRKKVDLEQTKEESEVEVVTKKRKKGVKSEVEVKEKKNEKVVAGEDSQKETETSLIEPNSKKSRAKKTVAEEKKTSETKTRKTTKRTKNTVDSTEEKAKVSRKKELVQEDVAPRKSSRKKNETVEMVSIPAPEEKKKKKGKKVTEEVTEKPVEPGKNRGKRVARDVEDPIPEKKARGRKKKEEPAVEDSLPSSDAVENRGGRKKKTEEKTVEENPPLATAAVENKRGRKKKNENEAADENSSPVSDPVDSKRSRKKKKEETTDENAPPVDLKDVAVSKRGRKKKEPLTDSFVEVRPLRTKRAVEDKVPNEELPIEKPVKGKGKKKKEETPVSVVTDESEAVPAVKRQREKEETTVTKRSKKQTDIRLPEDSPTMESPETKHTKKIPKNPEEVKPKGRRLKLIAGDTEPESAESAAPVKRRTRKAN